MTINNLSEFDKTDKFNRIIAFGNFKYYFIRVILLSIFMIAVFNLSVNWIDKEANIYFSVEDELIERIRKLNGLNEYEEELLIALSRYEDFIATESTRRRNPVEKIIERVQNRKRGDIFLADDILKMSLEKNLEYHQKQISK